MDTSNTLPAKTTTRYVNKQTGKWESIDTLTGEVIGEEGYYTPEKNIRYSIDIARQILLRIRNGETLTSICNSSNLPSYATLCLWKYRYVDFAEALKEAQKDAAQMFADQALERSKEAAIDKTEMEQRKVEIDTLKWRAEKADPNTFGKQTKVVGDANQPLALIVNTGIKRDGDE